MEYLYSDGLFTANCWGYSHFARNQSERDDKLDQGGCAFNSNPTYGEPKMKSQLRASHLVALLSLATLLAVVFVGCFEDKVTSTRNPDGKTYTVVFSHSITGQVISRQATLKDGEWNFIGRTPKRAQDIALGGPNHPIIVEPGQSLIISNDESMMWVSLLNKGFALYRDPLTGGDRAPDVLIPEENNDTIWYDNTRDILYTVLRYNIHAWDDASQMTTPRPFDRAIYMGGEMRLASITGDAVNDRLYIMTNNSPISLLRVDDASTLTGAHAPDAVILGSDAGYEAIAYDPTRDILYFGRGDCQAASLGRIDNASQADGDIAQGEVQMSVVEGAATGIDFPINSLQVDPETDTLFAAILDNDLLMFNNASGITGNHAPDGREHVADQMTGAFVFARQ